jgi:hypothetical protein
VKGIVKAIIFIDATINISIALAFQSIFAGLSDRQYKLEDSI